MKRLTKNSPIVLVELPPTQFGVLNGDIAIDEFSKFNLPARAIHSLAAVLEADNWKNIRLINPFYHGKNGKLTEENFDTIYNSDFLLLSSITRTAYPTMELGRRFKLKKPEGVSIAGGFDATFRPEHWKPYADFVVRGEAEKILLKLMNQIIEDGGSLKERVFGPEPLMSPEELSELPHPIYDKATKKGISVAAIETSRGCTNNCVFCSVAEFYKGKYRVKSDNWVIEELKRTRNIGIYNFFTDDNIAAYSNRTIRTLESVVENGLHKKPGVAQLTVKAAKSPALLTALKNAGIRTLCVGIESINDASLNSLGKPYSADENMEAVKTFREYGFWVHGMMIIGADGETPKSARETLEWAKTNLDSVQFFPLIPLPGALLYKQMEEKGRILTSDYSLYDGHHVVIKPENFTPYELQTTVINMYKDFYSPISTWKRLKHSPDKKLTLELLVYTKLFGGISNVTKSPQTKKHLEFLKSVS